MKTVRLSAEDRREQIIQVASELFAGQGFKGTTTRQIAQEAGITEALVFKYFETKDSLYRAIIDAKMKDLAEWDLTAVQTGIALRDDSGVFEGVALLLFREIHRDPTLMRLLLFSALEDRMLSDLFFKQQITDLVELLGEYITIRIRDGVFFTAEPMLAARGFIGMISHQVLMRDLFRHEAYVQYEDQAIASAYTKLFLDGIEIREAEACLGDQADGEEQASFTK